MLSGSLIVLLTLPVLPVATYATTSLPATIPDTANQVGWPQFVATVEQVVAMLPPDDRAHAVILTSDYSEASPLTLLVPECPRSTRATTAIGRGDHRRTSARSSSTSVTGDPTDFGDYFTDCRDVAIIDDGLGIENGEQGSAVSVCTGLRQPWSVMWPALRTIS